LWYGRSATAGRQFSDKPLHKQIRSLFNQFLMIFIDRRAARALTANEIPPRAQISHRQLR
jgi:hypothetical protein